MRASSTRPTQSTSHGGACRTPSRGREPHATGTRRVIPHTQIQSCPAFRTTMRPGLNFGQVRTGSSQPQIDSPRTTTSHPVVSPCVVRQLWSISSCQGFRASCGRRDNESHIHLKQGRADSRGVPLENGRSVGERCHTRRLAHARFPWQVSDNADIPRGSVENSRTRPGTNKQLSTRTTCNHRVEISRCESFTSAPEGAR